LITKWGDKVRIEIDTGKEIELTVSDDMTIASGYFPEEGDIVAVYCAGAYGFSMSSPYNSRPRCAEVLVNEGKAELIREPEEIEDLWRHQIIPKRLTR
jgi:hypothetical protein